MMLLGKLLKHVMQAQNSFGDEIAEVDPGLASAIGVEAERHGMNTGTFIADTISRFMAHEDGESWTTIVSNIQRSDDPGFAFISTVMRARLDHRCEHNS